MASNRASISNFALHGDVNKDFNNKFSPAPAKKLKETNLGLRAFAAVILHFEKNYEKISLTLFSYHNVDFSQRLFVDPNLLKFLEIFQKNGFFKFLGIIFQSKSTFAYFRHRRNNQNHTTVIIIQSTLCCALIKYF